MSLVSNFLIERLENIGVKHIFGVVGGHNNSFIENINNNSKIKFIANKDENSSGFAADIYARIQGTGCVCANYNAGALKLCNSIAGAYSEKSPVIVISMSPPIKSRNEDFLLHHVVRSFDNQQKIFKNITCYSTILNDATKAGLAIDEGLEALLKNKQPIYLELPIDVANSPIRYDVYRDGTPNSKTSDKETLQDAIKETSDWIAESKNPVILIGVQVIRYGLSKKIVRFAEKHNIPFMTTLLGKSSVDENNHLFRGVYCGSKTSDENVNAIIDQSDCLLVFGECLSDVTLGFQSPRFTKRHVVFCSTEGLYIKNHVYNNVTFSDFCNYLFEINFPSKAIIENYKNNEYFEDSKNNEYISEKYFFNKINNLICKDNNLAIIADAGDFLTSASKLRVYENRFFSPAFHYSTGFAIPGSLGLQLSKPELRPIVLLSENSFDISMIELHTLFQNKLNPIIFILSNNMNKFYNIEKFKQFFNFGNGFIVSNKDELDSVISTSLKSKEISLINVTFTKEST
jgi:indolepyruvate decarboxylase